MKAFLAFGFCIFLWLLLPLVGIQHPSSIQTVRVAAGVLLIMILALGCITLGGFGRR